MPSELDEMLDAQDGPGLVRFPRGEGAAEVEVVDVDRLGVRVRRVRVEREARDIAQEAERLPRTLRLPDPVHAIEVAPDLGGAVLRSEPRKGRYFEVDVRETSTEIRRVSVENGERAPEDFSLTREQLEEIVDGL